MNTYILQARTIVNDLMVFWTAPIADWNALYYSGDASDLRDIAICNTNLLVSSIVIPQIYAEGTSGGSGSKLPMYLGGVTNLTEFRVPANRTARVNSAQISAIPTSTWGSGSLRMTIEIYRNSSWQEIWSNTYTDSSDEIALFDVVLGSGELIRSTMQIISGTLNTVLGSSAFSVTLF